ncbi:AAA family ATPase [Paraliomyxa miuraensis]|uniref:AAA family ATPase n=1 Tax=Paraliomyxa miuraensis TaxID=376150 RepID=UPI002250F5FF|nr:AAA family ATPase [Paraliomyxa miuraensis]MCX4242180.1 AAA family ATPase [Paraliomyxa miuraensis]
MHLRSVSIRNIRSIAELTWDVEQHVTGDDLSGWHVILGDNGSGKSSVLRAIALALNGPDQAPALLQDWGTWLRKGCTEGSIGLHLKRHASIDWYLSEQSVPTPEDVDAEIRLIRLPKREVHGEMVTNEVVELSSDDGPREHVWSGLKGWFSSSYGPFRRFGGGDEYLERLFDTHPRLARHLTVFSESVALSRATDWLYDLKFKALEAEKGGHADGGAAGRLLQRLFELMNESGLLPHQTRITDVTSDDVLFVDGDGNDIPVDDLGDGYRSILSLSFELLRNLVAAFGGDRIFDAEGKVVVPGVVLIDEIDAHLHPQWQRRVGQWFLERFPRMQFIVTTHSPLVCQAAERGTIYRLPPPGSDEAGGFVRGADRDRLLYGNVLDAYETESFGVVPTRSDSGRRKLLRLADLNLKARREPLEPDEEAERDYLRTILPTVTRGEGIP